MSKKDYTKFSKNHDNNYNKTEHKVVPEVVYPLPEDDIPEETIVVTPEPISEAETIDQKPLVFGRVAGCSKLNVRQHPSLQADILCCLDVNTEVEIDEDKSANDFYAICTPSGREGFCLKKFIGICK